MGAGNPGLEFSSARDHRRTLSYHSIEAIAARAPTDYRVYSEAQRDKMFSARTAAFMRANPVLVIRTMFWKGYTFFTSWGQSVL